MGVSGYLAAAEALERAEPRAFALRTLDRLLREGWDAGSGRLRHVLAYSDGHTPATAAPGVLEDYAFMVHACLDGWQATAELRYYTAGEQIARAMVERFADRTAGGFFDTEQASGKPSDQQQPLLGVLGARRKPLQDAPTPAGNPTAAAALLRLFALNGDEELRELAEDTLECFGGVVAQFGLYAASYGLALERLLLPPVQVVVLEKDGPSDDTAQALAATARARYAVNRSLLRLRQEEVRAAALPPVLAETLPHLPQLGEPGSFAVVCRGAVCLPPVQDVEALLRALSGA